MVRLGHGSFLKAPRFGVGRRIFRFERQWCATGLEELISALGIGCGCSLHTIESRRGLISGWGVLTLCIPVVVVSGASRDTDLGRCVASVTDASSVSDVVDVSGCVSVDFSVEGGGGVSTRRMVISGRIVSSLLQAILGASVDGVAGGFVLVLVKSGNSLILGALKCGVGCGSFRTERVRYATGLDRSILVCGLVPEYLFSNSGLRWMVISGWIVASLSGEKRPVNTGVDESRHGSPGDGLEFTLAFKFGHWLGLRVKFGL